jgi:hypothetical protein
MKDNLFNLALAAIILAAAVAYYYGHGFIDRLMINGATSLVQLTGRQDIFAKAFSYTCFLANLVPISKAFWQSCGNTSARLFAFFSGSKRTAKTFE